MEEHLQKLVQQLGEAINDSINHSEAVNEAMERLRAVGQEPFLVLEATIALRAIEPPAPDDAPAEERLDEITHEDRQFLKSLKISFDNTESNE